MTAFRVDILEEHADEAAFRFRQRGRSFSSRLLRLRRLGEMDERLRAHLDGLAVAGPAGWKAAAGGLTSDDPSLVFVATVTGIAVGGPDVCAEIEASLEAPPSFAGLRWALRLAETEPIRPLLRRWIGHRSPLVRAFAVDALGFRGDEVPADSLGPLLSDSAPLILRSALGVVHRGRVTGHEARVRVLLRHDDPGVRMAALRAGLALDIPDAVDVTGEACGREGDEACHALAWAAAVGSGELSPHLRRALGGGLAREACFALGRVGNPGDAELLLSALGAPGTARAAGFALGQIFGVDVRSPGLELPPSRRPAPPDEMALDPDDDLPWPEPEAFAATVRAAAEEAPHAPRLRGGRPWSVAILAEEIDDGCLPGREAALRERFRHDRGSRWMEPRAWALDQKSRASGATALAPAPGSRSIG